MNRKPDLSRSAPQLALPTHLPLLKPTPTSKQEPVHPAMLHSSSRSRGAVPALVTADPEVVDYTPMHTPSPPSSHPPSPDSPHAQPHPHTVEEDPTPEIHLPSIDLSLFDENDDHQPQPEQQPKHNTNPASTLTSQPSTTADTPINPTSSSQTSPQQRKSPPQPQRTNRISPFIPFDTPSPDVEFIPTVTTPAPHPIQPPVPSKSPSPTPPPSQPRQTPYDTLSPNQNIPAHLPPCPVTPEQPLHPRSPSPSPHNTTSPPRLSRAHNEPHRPTTPTYASPPVSPAAHQPIIRSPHTSPARPARKGPSQTTSPTLRLPLPLTHSPWFDTKPSVPNSQAKFPKPVSPNVPPSLATDPHLPGELKLPAPAVTPQSSQHPKSATVPATQSSMPAKGAEARGKQSGMSKDDSPQSPTLEPPPPPPQQQQQQQRLSGLFDAYTESDDNDNDSPDAEGDTTMKQPDEPDDPESPHCDVPMTVPRPVSPHVSRGSPSSPVSPSTSLVAPMAVEPANAIPLSRPPLQPTDIIDVDADSPSTSPSAKRTENHTQKEAKAMLKPDDPELRLAIPRLKGPSDPEPEAEPEPEPVTDVPGLISSPEGSDFEMEDSQVEERASILCPDVQRSLAVLPLRNIAVYVPSFLDLTPTPPNDRAVVSALEDFLETEKARRAQDAYAVSNPPRSILVVAADSCRAQAWEEVLTQHSRMSVATHGIEKYGQDRRDRRRDSQALNSVFQLKDVIITVGHTAYADAERNYLYLRRVALLVLDVDFDTVSDYEPTFSERGHPCALLMHDYYRALPLIHRPRVLAITTRKLFAAEVPPIEHNLFCRFLSPNVKDEVEWRSCYGKGSRAVESSMMDVECLFYSAKSVPEATDLNFRGGRRRSSGKAKRERAKLSELEFLAEQVGPLGVALYQRRWKQRYAGKLAGLPKSSESVNSAFPMSCDMPLVGLSEKVLHLLNELQRAYAASTRGNRLNVIIHAGRPTVACALGEIIRAIPVFQRLEVGVVLGDDNGKSFESYALDSEGQKISWQGEETDDEAVSSFASGDANILVVARTFCTRNQRNRPLPPCPFVLRFDDSMPDPSMDGGGGRCRVVQFKESTRNRSNGSHLQGNNGKSSDPETENLTQSGPIPSEVEEVVKRTVVKGKEKLSLSDSDQERPRAALEEVDREPTADNKKPGEQIDEDYDDEGAQIYYCRPPRVLLGPDATRSTCFLYRAFVFEAVPGLLSPPVGATARKIGVEDFVLVFSEKLNDRDRTVILPDTSSRSAGNSTAGAYLKLDYQGEMSLSSDQVLTGRQYTSAIFSLASPSFSAKGAHWDGVRNAKLKDSCASPEEREATGFSYLRRYLVLPVCERNGQNPTQPPHSDLAVYSTKKISDHNGLMDAYFREESRPSEVKWPEFACNIDWDAVQNLLAAVASENGSEQPLGSNSLLQNQFCQLEGKLVKSRFPGEPVVISGRLQYGLSPLSQHVRSKKFTLNDDGTLAPQDHLSSLVSVSASEETVTRQAKAAEQDGDSFRKINMNGGSLETRGDEAEVLAPAQKTTHIKGIDTSPVKWSAEEKCFVFDRKSAGRKRKHDELEPSLFDVDRNVSKKRKTWVGKIYCSYEEYYRKHEPSGLKFLDQPLLVGARSFTCSYDQFLEAVRSKPISDICDAVVKKALNQRILIPELCHLYPVSTGVMFLPAVLFHLEKHLSICELRKNFDQAVGVTGSLEELRQCVTAEHVNKSWNYERLEFLGDSVLKLSCTKRLFARRPHDSEGQMHNARAFRVSNERLHRLGSRIGLHHHLQFTEDTVEEWRPPGTDVKGKAQKLTVKGLADVVEALCGAYFLFGVKAASEDRRTGEEKMELSQKRSEANLLGFYSDSDSSSESASESGDLERVDRLARLDNEDGERASDKKPMTKERSEGKRGQRIQPFTAEEVERGYKAGYRFLEECKIFEDEEPTHAELLLSAIHAMHPPGSKPPRAVSFEAFPEDPRLTHPKAPWEEEFGQLEKKLRYTFKRRHLLMCALTHNSYVKSNGRSTKDQQTFQRLEYFGDAVADLCVVVYLYHRYPELGPGELTELKSNVVSNEAFARQTVRMGLHKYLYHGSTALTAEIENFISAVDAEKEQGHGPLGALKRTMGEIAAPKVLGDIFESVLGAIYVDSGIQQVWRVCMHLLADSLRINADPRRDDRHPSQELQELVTRSWKLSANGPRYELEASGGNSHGKKSMGVYILGEKIATGFGTTVKRAKLKAATAALTLLKDEDPNSAGAVVLRRLKEECVKRQLEEKNAYR